MEVLAPAFGSTSIEVELIEELNRFRELILPRVPKVVTHTGNSLLHFRGKSTADQQVILDNFRNYSRLIASVLVIEPSALFNEAELLRHVVAKLRLVISDDVYSSIDDDTVVEVYNLEFVQVYRSLKFMDLCNYSLLELLTHEFYELYERSTSVNEYIFSTIEVLRADGTLKGRPLSVPKHLMRERFSGLQQVFEVDFGHMFPVYRWPNEFCGVVSTLRGKPYRENTLPENITFI